MSWTTDSTKLNNDQTQIRGSNVSGLSVRGDNSGCYNTLFSSFSIPNSHGGSLTLYSSL